MVPFVLSHTVQPGDLCGFHHLCRFYGGACLTEVLNRTSCPSACQRKSHLVSLRLSALSQTGLVPGIISDWLFSRLAATSAFSFLSTLHRHSLQLPTLPLPASCSCTFVTSHTVYSSQTTQLQSKWLSKSCLCHHMFVLLCHQHTSTAHQPHALICCCHLHLTSRLYLYMFLGHVLSTMSHPFDVVHSWTPPLIYIKHSSLTLSRPINDLQAYFISDGIIIH